MPSMEVLTLDCRYLNVEGGQNGRHGVNNIEIGAGAVVVAGEIEVHGPGCDHDVMI